MKRLPVLIAIVACVSGQTPLSIPSWLVSFPGTTPQTKTSSGYFESTYEVSAKPQEIITHYKKLFEAQGLPFQPNFDGMGTAIRGETREYSLLLLIRPQGSGSWVQVSGAAKSTGNAGATATVVNTSPAQPRASSMPSIEQRKAEMQEQTRKVLEQDREKHREQIRAMEKYDRPVYPRPKGQPPALVWPAWLGATDGSRIESRKGVDQFGRKFLRSAFTADGGRAAIQAYYADLLNANGYPVRIQSIASAPRDRKGWVEGERYVNGTSGPKTVMRVDLVPAGDLISVELRITAYP